MKARNLLAEGEWVMGSDVNPSDPPRQAGTPGLILESLDELLLLMHVEEKTFEHKLNRNVCPHATDEH